MDKKRNLEELLNALEKCREAQKKLKKRQQKYRIKQYYKNAENKEKKPKTDK